MPPLPGDGVSGGARASWWWRRWAPAVVAQDPGKHPRKRGGGPRPAAGAQDARRRRASLVAGMGDPRPAGLDHRGWGAAAPSPGCMARGPVMAWICSDPIY